VTVCKEKPQDSVGPRFRQQQIAAKESRQHAWPQVTHSHPHTHTHRETSPPSSPVPAREELGDGSEVSAEAGEGVVEAVGLSHRPPVVAAPLGVGVAVDEAVLWVCKVCKEEVKGSRAGKGALAAVHGGS
jgi:hypothetical protein